MMKVEESAADAGLGVTQAGDVCEGAGIVTFETPEGASR